MSLLNISAKLSLIVIVSFAIATVSPFPFKEFTVVELLIICIF